MFLSLFPVRFGDNMFAAYIGESTWSAASGNKVPYMVLNICKRKSEEAKKNSKSDKAYYTTDINARRIGDLYSGLTKLLCVSNMDPLPMDTDLVKSLTVEDLVEFERRRLEDEREIAGTRKRRCAGDNTSTPPKRACSDLNKLRKRPIKKKMLEKVDDDEDTPEGAIQFAQRFESLHPATKRLAKKEQCALEKFCKMRLDDDRVKRLQKRFAERLKQERKLEEEEKNGEGMEGSEDGSGSDTEPGEDFDDLCPSTQPLLTEADKETTDEEGDDDEDGDEDDDEDGEDTLALIPTKTKKKKGKSAAGKKEE